jgi:hypothetical protein
MPCERQREVVRIDALDLVGFHHGHANVVADHQFGKPVAIDEDDYVMVWGEATRKAVLQLTIKCNVLLHNSLTSYIAET